MLTLNCFILQMNDIEQIKMKLIKKGTNPYEISTDNNIYLKKTRLHISEINELSQKKFKNAEQTKNAIDKIKIYV